VFGEWPLVQEPAFLPPLELCFALCRLGRLENIRFLCVWLKPKNLEMVFRDDAKHEGRAELK
jgi:hypothetical protein